MGADIIAVSALLRTMIPSQRKLIELLGDIGLRNKYKVLIGGAPATPEYARRLAPMFMVEMHSKGSRKQKDLWGSKNKFIYRLTSVI
ncbi:hypothetical protein AKJ47_00815 [candidate division MSBL1 archaeon SCGC-AAA261G05]|uniref:B12-binding domain-containing protein n=2 Tax=candidate division MSBL1 TaxID=215777 RepID=A0A133V1L9_9EURY|nr:hypothetical protein AKJ42_01125 [candidate division MSBL1 archaeon SCGC-AAA261C02]KXB04069.1 hypothetical protein AKJ47_00815 [candidate division MSBL1 archaeon SCGC-AAA261G05]